jgi:hypothetical protein
MNTVEQIGAFTVMFIGIIFGGMIGSICGCIVTSLCCKKDIVAKVLVECVLMLIGACYVCMMIRDDVALWMDKTNTTNATNVINTTYATEPNCTHQTL